MPGISGTSCFEACGGGDEEGWGGAGRGGAEGVGLEFPGFTSLPSGDLSLSGATRKLTISALDKFMNRARACIRFAPDKGWRLDHMT